jgi:hypothetical protein
MSIVLEMEFEFQGKNLNDENIVLNNWIFSSQFANKCRKILEDFDKSSRNFNFTTNDMVIYYTSSSERLGDFKL